jgi:hypothetical protein
VGAHGVRQSGKAQCGGEAGQGVEVMHHTQGGR